MKSWSAGPESELSFLEVSRETYLCGLEVPCGLPFSSEDCLWPAADLATTQWSVKVECDLDPTLTASISLKDLFVLLFFI